MTSYYSVINTAKNGKLIRAEIREYVLGMALFFGFYKNRSQAGILYPNNEHRIEQCTFLDLYKQIPLDQFVPDPLIKTAAAVIKTIGTYFKKRYEDEHVLKLYDTKKFRIYNKRLRYGPKKKITLKKTIQYIWTNYLAMLFCLYGKHTWGPGWCSVSISHFNMYQHAKDRRETDAYIRNYLENIVKAKCHIIDGIIYFECYDEYAAFKELAVEEAVKIYRKLEKGKYLA